jgi:hypothetical protein
MKFFLLSFLFTAVLTAVCITEYWKNIFSKVLISIIVFYSCISGILSIFFTFQAQHTISTTQDLQIAQIIKDTTSSDSVFLTSDAHNHLVPMVAGRPVVLGYRGWLWTHGIQYGQTNHDVDLMFKGGQAAKDLLSKHNVKYVFIGQTEKHQYQVNDQYFKKNFEVLYTDETTTIYKI